MKADFQGSPATVPPAATNGAHRAVKKSAAAPKRSAGSDESRAARVEPLAASFAATEAAPIDAGMWPLHSAVWFQPERAPSVPQWSGLAIERQQRLPAPDFVCPGVAPLNGSDTLDTARVALMPDARPKIPESDMAPLGWDPRTVCRKEECE